MNFDISLPAGGIPHLEQYSGLWAMAEDSFLALADHCSRVNLSIHMAGQSGKQQRGVSTSVEGGVGIVELRGTLMKQASSLTGGTSTVEARRAVRHFAADESIKAILLQIESPGGTASGTMELADDVARAKQVKPVVAQIEDLGASAAYWIASQASEIVANPMAKVGSIGTFGVVHDSSKMAERLGVAVHVIRAGDFKGAGIPGTEITEEHLSELQRLVDQTNDFFLAGVAAGRGMSPQQVRTLADGRVHMAADAVALGLIDDVRSIESTLASLQRIGNRKAERAESSLNWRTEVAQTLTAMKSKRPNAKWVDAVKAVEAAHPGLRTQYLKSVNGE